jgi:hypothetical protein
MWHRGRLELKSSREEGFDDNEKEVKRKISNVTAARQFGCQTEPHTLAHSDCKNLLRFKQTNEYGTKIIEV